MRHPQKPHRFAHSFGWRCWTKFSSKPGAKSLAQINTVLSMSHSQIRRPENGQKLNLDDAGIPVSSRLKNCSFQLAHRQSPESLQKGSLSDETGSSRNHLIFRWGLSHPAPRNPERRPRFLTRLVVFLRFGGPSLEVSSFTGDSQNCGDLGGLWVGCSSSGNSRVSRSQK